MASLPIVLILHYLITLGVGPSPAAPAPQPAPVVKIDTAMQQERIALPDGSVHEETITGLASTAYGMDDEYKR